MYLNIIRDKETKLAFLEMAYFLSITDIKNDNVENYKDEEETSNFFTRGFSFDEIKNINKIKLIMARKGTEANVLTAFAKELDAFNLESLEVLAKEDPLEHTVKKNSSYEREIDGFVDRAIHKFVKINETTSEKLLTTQEIRTRFIKDSISFILVENNLENISPEEKKVILFELVGMAYADSEISKSEKEVLDHACDIFDIDYEFIDDSKKIVAGMFDLQKRGLELINE